MLANCWKFWNGKILTTNKTFKRSWGLSTGHIPQVKSTIHFSINKLLNHKYSPRSRRAFCKTIGTRRHFWCCLFICVMVTSCTLLTMTWGKWLVFQTHQNTSYNLRDSPRTNLKFDFPTQIISNSLVVMVVPHWGIAFLARHVARSLLGCSNEQLAKLFNTQHSWMVSSLTVKVINV